MKPFFEKVTSADDSSWTMLNRRLDDGIPFEWHHHPEYELTLTLNSNGQRFVGDHIGTYSDGDLVLLGPDLPHTWAGSEKIDGDKPHVALVMWFRADWAETLTSVLTELQPVAHMLTESRSGIKFSEQAVASVRPVIEALFELPPAERLLRLIEVLTRLAADPSAQRLATPTSDHSAITGPDRPRIDRVLEHVHAHYETPLSIDELANIAALSPSGFHRLFRRHTRLTLSEYIARLRVGRACAMLSAGDQPIAFIADAVGYGALANFNRQFRRFKGMTPREFRNSFRKAT